MHNSKIIFLFIIITYLLSPLVVLDDSILAEEQNPQQDIRRGVWVTVFSDKRVLYSKSAAKELIEFCKETGINEIYLQLYRSGIAYYDSSIGTNEKYKDMLKIAGADTVDFLLSEASKNNVKIFAWINVLSIGQNRKADIVVKFGNAVLTRDQHLRASLRAENKNESDKYYLRDEQLFLEPGDPRVEEYILSIVDEVITRYPMLSGIHLDYIRYPNSIPFIPDSRFNKYGLSYGYGENNIARFKKTNGFDPLATKDEKYNYLIWDNWKRDRITALVERISKYVKNRSPNLLVSCAVIPSPERAYSVAFQDWSFWLEKGIIDYVVLMNYTIDNRLAEEIAKSALSHRGRSKIYVGIGTFLMKNKKKLFFEQYKAIVDLKPDGIVFFSYDDITKEMVVPDAIFR